MDARAKAHLLKAAALAAAVAACAHSFTRWADSNAMDFYQFWLVGQATGAVPADSLWTAEGRAALGQVGARLALAPGATDARRRAAGKRLVLETYSTPLLYAAFGALSTGDYELDYRLFHAVSLAGFAGAVLWLCWLFGWPAAGALFSLALAALLFEPLTADARVGNVNELQLAFVALLLSLRRRSGESGDREGGQPAQPGPSPATGGAHGGRCPQVRSRGAALGAGAVAALLTLFKPNLLPAFAAVAALLAGSRRWRSLAWTGLGAAAAGLAAVAWSSARLGSWHAWGLWLSALGRLPPQTVAMGNLSIPAALGLGRPAVLLGPAAAVLALAFLAGRRGAARWEHEVAALGAGLAVTLLFAPLSWTHYYLLLLAPLLFLLRPGAPSRPLALAAALLTATPPELLRFADPRHALLVQLALGAALTLLLCGRALFTAPRPACPPGGATSASPPPGSRSG